MLNKFLRDILGGLKVFHAVEGTEAARRRDPFGSDYTALTSGGVKPEGHVFPRLYPTADEAWAAFGEHLRRFVADADAVFFRAAPEMVAVGADGYSVWCRLSAHKAAA